MRMRRKPHRAERMARCADLLITEPRNLRGRWADAYPGYREIHLELGCGKGSFTVETAMQTTDAFIVAFEKSADALVIALERAQREGIPNVRFINGFAEDLPALFSPAEVTRIYINFCDPWPANRHAKRRLTSSRLLDMYKEVLAPGGEIHFKTDNDALFEFSLAEFELRGFETREVTRDLHRDGQAGVMTDYERKFHAEGVSINRCVARLESSDKRDAAEE